MTPERWSHIKELFEAVIELPPSGRLVFLNQVCAGDEALRSELDRLITAHERASGFMCGSTETLAPAPAPAPAFADGCIVAGRFRIVKFLGRGGMGEVYEAWDAELRQTMALKTLLPEVSSDPRAGERLLKEILNGRRVTHRNVCRIYDLARHHALDGDVVILTMELIDGETLFARLKTSGPLAAPLALDFARQMAAALDAAHREGIVHRDFKSGNVMLADKNDAVRVVVTDFGLARMSQPQTEEISLTVPGAVVGTPAYMAPELFAGQEATPASDIYSFGVVLCEIVTGQRPPAGQSILESDPLLAKWDRVVARCLQHDPAKRFGSAMEAVQAIESGTPTVQDRTPAKPVRSTWRRFIAYGGTIFAAVSLFLVVLRIYWQRPPAKEGSALMLADTINSTGDHDLDFTTELFRSQLAQSAYFTLWDRSKLPPVLRLIERPADSKLDGSLAREVAMRESVPFVVFSNVSPLGDQIVVNIRLESLEAGTIFSRRRWTHTVQAGSRGELNGAIQDACNWLRRTLGENQRDMAARDRLPEEVTTSSWEALRAYSRAEAFQSEGQSDVAVQVLKEAVTLDGHFALAYMRLGDILMSMSQQEEALRYWRLAETEDNRGRLTRREDLRLRGLYSGDTWDWSGYESAFAQMEREYPHDYLAPFYLADALREQGKFQASAYKLQESARERPGSAAVTDNLGHCYLLMHDTGAAEGQAQELDRLGRSDLSNRLRGVACFYKQDLPGALEYFDKQAAVRPPLSRSAGFWMHAAVLAESGQVNAAENSLQQGIEEDRRLGLVDQGAGKTIALGYLRWRQGDVTGAQREITAGSVATNAPSQLLEAALLLARTGKYAEASALVARIRKIAGDTKMTAIADGLVRGEVSLRQGKAREAVELFIACSRIDSALRPKDGLARALMAAGKPEEALLYFQRITAEPELIYEGPEKIFPGEFTDLLFEQASCAIAAHRAEDARVALREYLKRRVAADVNLTQVAKARQLLARL